MGNESPEAIQADRGSEQIPGMKLLGEHRVEHPGPDVALAVPIGALAAPGAPSHLILSVVAPHESRSEQQRLLDRSMRTFTVSMQMSPHATPTGRLSLTHRAEAGGSLVHIPEGSCEIGTMFGPIRLDVNARREMSLLTMEVAATSCHEASVIFRTAIGPFLDAIAYKADVPVRLGAIKVVDKANGVQDVQIIGPDRVVSVSETDLSVHPWMLPVYALYREFRGADSPFYRLLCAYKTLEGIFGELRPRTSKRARELKVDIARPKERVPDHPDMPDDLRHLVGMPIKAFYDQVLQKQYRDFVAHFLIQRDQVLYVGSPEAHERFTAMAFVVGLCVRTVVANEEAFLVRLDAAIADERGN